MSSLLPLFNMVRAESTISAAWYVGGLASMFVLVVVVTSPLDGMLFTLQQSVPSNEFSLPLFSP